MWQVTSPGNRWTGVYPTQEYAQLEAEFLRTLPGYADVTTGPAPHRPDPAVIAARAITEYGACQHLWEFAAVLSLLMTDPPELVLEIGSWRGGTLWAWQAMGADVIGVTLPDAAVVCEPYGATMIYEDSTTCQPVLEKALGDRVPGFVFIDGAHDEKHVQSDWELAQAVAPGAVVGFHDLANDNEPDVRVVFARAARAHPSARITHPYSGQGWGLIFT